MPPRVCAWQIGGRLRHARDEPALGGGGRYRGIMHQATRLKPPPQGTTGHSVPTQPVACRGHSA
eukprot:5193140-Pyramimonas_sp.AAC.1